MIQGSIQKYSPRWVADKIREGEERVFNFFLRLIDGARWVHIFNLAVFLIFLCFTFYSKRIALIWGGDISGERLLLINRYSNILNILFLLTAFGTLAYYVKRESLAAFDTLGFIIGMASVFFFKSSFFGNGPFALSINFISVFVFFMLFYALRKSFKFKFLKWDFIIAAFLVMSVSYLADIYFDLNSSWFFDVPRMLFIFAMLAAEHQVNRQSSTGAELSYIFSAMNLVTPVPVEAKYRERTDEWATRLMGLKDIILGLMFILMAQNLKTKLGVFPIEITFVKLLIYGFINYIYYYLGSLAWIGVPVGIGRWYGMKLPAYFEMPLLACSPSDRWRRWNTYYYNWFYKILFFPIFKKTRSLALAVFAVFWATLIMHSGRLTYGIVLLDSELLRTRNFILISSFFAIHALLIYLGIKLPKIWPSENSRWGWMGVGLMTLIMALVHIIAPR